MRTQTTRTISGRVNTDGSVLAASGGAFASRRSAAGLYFLTFPAARLVGVTATTGGGNYFPSADTFTTDGCRIAIANSAGSANTDAAFSFTATVTA